MYFSHFHKNFFSTYLTYKNTHILLTLLTFFALPILQKLQIYHVWFLFGTTPGGYSYLGHFGAIDKYQNDEQNLNWNVFY